MPAGPDDLPAEFPIFPLGGALLLPGGRLPLNIFEKRYLRMVDDALSSGRVIGMIQPDDSRKQTPSGPALYKVGCLGRVSSFSETDDGRYLITLTGIIRFGVQVELEVHRGYRRVRADLARFRPDLDAAPASDGRPDPARQIDRDGLLAALRAYFDAHGFDANWESIAEMPDTGLVNTLSMVCPFEPPEKQALLEAMTEPDRASVLLALLQMGAHAVDMDRADRRAT